MTSLWGINYSASTFSEKSGILPSEATVDELAALTVYFAKNLNDLSDEIPRDNNGIPKIELSDLFEQCDTVFDTAEQQFSFLKLPARTPKAVHFSRFMSRFDTSGVFFPFTGEANINIDAPLHTIPATMIHEISHQRNVASEQEANFIAVVACTESSNKVFAYSGYQLGFNHLANALYRESPKIYSAIYSQLNDNVKADLKTNNEYWRQFESKASEISDSIYDGYLKSQGQTLGTKSYGAVVDMMVSYYNDTINSILSAQGALN